MYIFLALVLLSGVMADDGYGSSGGYGSSSGGGKYGPINAAIKSTRTVEVRTVSLPQDAIQTQVVNVEPLELPVRIIYNARSSPVVVEQVFVPGARGQVERTSSKEEPHTVIHEVVRPVVQELREVITPYRRIVQEIAPVVETVNTIVSQGGKAREAPQPQKYYAAAGEILKSR